MAIAYNRATWVAPLIFAAVLWMALAPETADAHSDYLHETPRTRAHKQDATAPGFEAAALPTGSLSPFCPGGSGHACECSNLSALVRADKTFAFHCSGEYLPIRLPVGRIKPPTFKAAPPSAPLLSPASPRAPPLFS